MCGAVQPFGLEHGSLGTPAAAPESAGDDQRGAEKSDRIPWPPGGNPPRTQVPLKWTGGGVLLAAVMLPADVFAWLQGMGAVEAADLGGEQSFTLASKRLKLWSVDHSSAELVLISP